MSSSTYASAAPDVLAEIIREAEARLAAQLTGAIAADQRAMTFAGLMLAAAGALIGAALGSAPDAVLAVPVFVTAVGLLASSVFAVVAARPVDWDWVGNAPRAWAASIAEPLHNSLADMAQFYDDMIEENERAIAGAAFWIRLSMISALLTLLLGLIFAAARLF